MGALKLSKKRWLLILSATSFTTGAFIFATREELYYNWRLPLLTIIAVAWGLMGVGLSAILLYYLRGDLGPERRRRVEDRAALQGLTAEVEEIKQRVAEALVLSPVGESADSATIRLHLRDELFAHVADRFQDQYSAAAQEAERLMQVRRNFETAIDRLRHEISVLGRRANLNLIIGVLVTMVAAAGLLSLLVPTAEEPTWPHFLEYYLPRIGTVVLVEIFGFFFLRLYKSSLLEVKYYQNEITSLTMHWNAFEAAGLSNVSAIVVDQFAKSDRNLQPGAAASSPAGAVDPKLVAQIVQKTAETFVKPTG